MQTRKQTNEIHPESPISTNSLDHTLQSSISDPEWCHSCQERKLELLLGIHFTDNNRIVILRNGDEIFPAMLDAILAAKISIEFLTFVYWKGEIAKKFAHALAQKASEGITVRVMLDAIGAAKMSADLVKTMELAGVRVNWFRPITNLKLWRYDNRTHRKILICDNSIGFTGGVGIAEEWEGDARNPDEWRETHLQLQGSALDGLSAAFWDNWLEMRPDDLPNHAVFFQQRSKSGQDRAMVVRSSPDGDTSTAAILMRASLEAARNRLSVATPYFVPDERMLEVLCRKAQEGVNVQIVIPCKYLDTRFEQFAAEDVFQKLLDSGVEIYHYNKTMMHQKVLLVDDHLSLVGSMNFNQRSLRRDAEVIVVMSGTKLNCQLRKHFEEDLAVAERRTSVEWAHRSVWRRCLEYASRPFKSQL